MSGRVLFFKNLEKSKSPPTDMKARDYSWQGSDGFIHRFSDFLLLIYMNYSLHCTTRSKFTLKGCSTLEFFLFSIPVDFSRDQRVWCKHPLKCHVEASNDSTCGFRADCHRHESIKKRILDVNQENKKLSREKEKR